MASPSVGVGIGVFLLKPTGEFVIGKRKGSLGAGTYALPGGHLEFGESFESCAAREVLEETGITIDTANIRYITCVNNVFPEGRHYVTIAMGCLLNEGEEPKNMEPEKCEGWEWIRWSSLRDSVKEMGAEGTKKWFRPMVSFVEQREKFDPFEACSGPEKGV